jgi:hypothetical protein
MSHQDSHARGMRLNSADLLKALQWLTGGTDWSAVRMRSESSWKPQWLAWAAMLWALSNETTLTERFFFAQRLIRHLQGECAKVSTSYQAFLKVLIRWTEPLLKAIQINSSAAGNPAAAVADAGSAFRNSRRASGRRAAGRGHPIDCRSGLDRPRDQN